MLEFIDNLALDGVVCEYMKWSEMMLISTQMKPLSESRRLEVGLNLGVFVVVMEFDKFLYSLKNLEINKVVQLKIIIKCQLKFIMNRKISALKLMHSYLFKRYFLPRFILKVTKIISWTKATDAQSQPWTRPKPACDGLDQAKFPLHFTLIQYKTLTKLISNTHQTIACTTSNLITATSNLSCPPLEQKVILLDQATSNHITTTSNHITFGHHIKPTSNHHTPSYHIKIKSTSHHLQVKLPFKSTQQQVF